MTQAAFHPGTSCHSLRVEGMALVVLGRSTHCQIQKELGRTILYMPEKWSLVAGQRAPRAIFAMISACVNIRLVYNFEPEPMSYRGRCDSEEDQAQRSTRCEVGPTSGDLVLQRMALEPQKSQVLQFKLNQSQRAHVEGSNCIYVGQLAVQCRDTRKSARTCRQLR